MRKIPLSGLLHGAMITVTAAAITGVLFGNLFPAHDDMIVLDGASPPSSYASFADSSSSATLTGSQSDTSSDSLGTDVSGGGSSSVSDVSAAGGKININTASVSELMTLSGIGETRAKAIVEYRDAHGGFSSIEELVKVSGIGEKTLENNRNMITV